jgi:hypothetical protein
MERGDDEGNELLRTLLLQALVNEGKKKGRGLAAPAQESFSLDDFR